MVKSIRCSEIKLNRRFERKKSLEIINLKNISRIFIKIIKKTN